MSQITVIGAAVSGSSLAKYAKTQGHTVFVSDHKPIPQDTQKEFDLMGINWEEGHTDRAYDCDLLLLSSGLSPQTPIVKNALHKNLKIMGELDFLTPHLKAPVIAITGTNGKTTTTSLIGHILKKNGLKVATVGNIGLPMPAAADLDLDAIVMELSSFQLHWNTTLKPKVAIITNLEPDHIDWHGNYQNYINDKCKIFSQNGSGSYAITQYKDRHLVPSSWTSIPLGGQTPNRIELAPTYAQLILTHKTTTLLDYHALPLIGRHNLENAAMAATACLALNDFNTPLDCNTTTADFQIPPHRCQLIGTWNGVTFIDDSKATNVASAKASIEGVKGPKIVILGGKGKGEDYTLLAQVVKQNALHAITLGEEADKIEKSLKEAGFNAITRVPNMQQAVKTAITLAPQNSTVLLAPACTSWDMYPSYNHRGDHFTELVKKWHE